MNFLFVRNQDNKITTVFEGQSREDATASCPPTHRIEDYQEINPNLTRFAYFINGSVEYTKTQEEVELEGVLFEFRAERNRRLAASDWTQVPDAPVDQAAWAVYRQQLRDLPDNTQDPRDPVWPTPPA